MAYIQDWGMRVQAQPQINTTRRAFLHLSQNENGRMLNIRITDVNIPTGSTAVLAGTKPDGTVYSQAGTLAGNTATFAEDVQMTAVAGTWDAKITVTNGGNCICTARITITIDPDTVAGGAIPSDSQLDGIIAECRAIADSVRKEAYGSPLVADAVEDMTDQSRVYVYTGSESGMTAGHWYYYNGSAWTDGGVYNAVAVDTDTTLSISGKAADAKKVGDELADVKEDLSEIITDVESANLFNKNTATAESETLYISDYIPIENGKTYTWYSTYNRNFVVYDSNKGNEWTLYGNNNNGIHTVTVDRTGAAFARFKLVSGNLDSAMLVEGDTYPSSYIPYVQYKQIKNGVKLPDYFYASNPLYGKKIAVNGDSIMYGAGYAGGFAKMIADENLMSFVNNAESGGCITSGNNTSGGNPAHCICDTVSSMPDDADYILFDGGINDMWHDIPLGTYTDDMSVVGDTTTFYGALDKLFQTALGKWSSGQKIVFVITHKIGNTWRAKRSISGLSFADYREAIIKMCLKYSIPYCDIYGISQFNTELQYYYDTYTTNDGTHPNQLGYEYFYKTQVQNFLKTL